jgi:D-alanyl-D-alanine endopeptidase (penicillin-binding protein 7)
MQAKLAGRKLILVFLDSAGRNSRLGDAERVRRWITESVLSNAATTTAAAAGVATAESVEAAVESVEAAAE